MVATRKLTPFEEVNLFFDQAAESLGLSDGHRDRKSTRLNSSHKPISYAVFCLKKKKNKTHTHT